MTSNSSPRVRIVRFNHPTEQLKQMYAIVGQNILHCSTESECFSSKTTLNRIPFKRVKISSTNLQESNNCHTQHIDRISPHRIIYYLFRLMAHLRRTHSNNLYDVEAAVQKFFVSKNHNWYRRGIDLARRFVLRRCNTMVYNLNASSISSESKEMIDL